MDGSIEQRRRYLQRMPGGRPAASYRHFVEQLAGGAASARFIAGRPRATDKEIASVTYYRLPDGREYSNRDVGVPGIEQAQTKLAKFTAWERDGDLLIEIEGDDDKVIADRADRFAGWLLTEGHVF